MKQIGVELPWARMSTAAHLEPLLEYAKRRAVLTVLRRHPEWTLGQVFSELERNRDRAPLLRDLTLGELFENPDELNQIAAAADGGLPVDRRRLDAAKRLTGADFDECVRAVILEAAGTPVGASYLRARVGGPRWKLQESLRRLVHAGEISRSGSTSATRYRIAGEHREQRRP
jgi:hypothetical protein